MQILPGYQGTYQVLGFVKAEYDTQDLSDLNVFWVHKHYKETWKQILCYPQAPLKCLTLGAWNIIPTSWPCWKKLPSTEEERREFLIEVLMKGTKAMGGNLLVLSSQVDERRTVIEGIGQTNGGFTNVYGSISDVTTRAKGLSGFILRQN
jgi:hypothetical protein